ncbi:MAG: hypothetical protein WAL38_22770 [Solirubrobacteraceae bacterium]
MPAREQGQGLDLGRGLRTWRSRLPDVLPGFANGPPGVSPALITLLERGALTIEWPRRIVGLCRSAVVRLVDRLADDAPA